jgi:DNA-binding XRE family transcriptional regulator
MSTAKVTPEESNASRVWAYMLGQPKPLRTLTPISRVPPPSWALAPKRYRRQNMLSHSRDPEVNMCHEWPNAERLRALRHACLLTQSEAGWLAGIYRRTLESWESGRCRPTTVMLRRLLAVYSMRIQITAPWLEMAKRVPPQTGRFTLWSSRRPKELEPPQRPYPLRRPRGGPKAAGKPSPDDADTTTYEKSPNEAAMEKTSEQAAVDDLPKPPDTKGN